MHSEVAAGLYLALTGTPNEEYRAEIDRRLKEFNDSQSALFRQARLPGGDAQPLDVYLLGESGLLHGGLVGFTVWGWLYIDRLWLAAGWRGHDYGSRVMHMAEAEARVRGCRYAHLRTFSFQARGFYEKLGFRVVGQLDEYPPGHTFYWMRKDYAAGWSEPAVGN